MRLWVPLFDLAELEHRSTYRSHGLESSERDGPPRCSLSQRVRVLVADDHPIYREGIVRAVKDRPDLELVGEAGDGRERARADQEPRAGRRGPRHPHAGARGHAGAARLQARRQSTTEVLFLSAFMESELAYTTVAEGARGLPLEGVARARRSATRSCPCRAATPPSRPRSRPASPGDQQRERVARPARAEPARVRGPALIAEGLSAPDIAKQIHLSPTTVKTHLDTLYEKLGVSDRAAAVAEGMRRGLLE